MVRRIETLKPGVLKQSSSGIWVVFPVTTRAVVGPPGVISARDVFHFYYSNTSVMAP